MVIEMKSSLWFMLVLAGCAVARPSGSYKDPVPEPVEDADAAPPGFGGGDVGKRADASVKIPRRDGSTNQSSSSSPLAPYTGMYLMRMDMFSTSETNLLATTMRVTGRVSNLVLAEVRIEDDQLVSHETLCHQTFANECEGCSDGSWRVTPDDNLAKFFPRASASRALAIGDGEISGDLAVMAIGFDDENVSERTKLPARADDDRLWKLDPQDPDRVGLRTRLQTQVLLAKLDCVVTAAQLFASRFVGALGEDPESPLEHAAFTLDTAETAGSSLEVGGQPPIYCNQQLLAMQAPAQPSTQIVRFHRTDITDSCPPVTVFDEALPPDPP